ncbi:MAG: hypothetical protein O3A19_02855 [Planctomycetota bacterium]|jgi:hypothetical protein|nr:hypothetical protein [Planctomycetota bacterium]MDA1025347.1 hypothetical protein [Planctomycetota bacterium]
MPFGGGGAGGLGAIGMFIMPISIAVMFLKQPPGPVSKLIKAGAIDPETARRPEGIDIPRPFVLGPAVKRGIVRRMSDGRYWVDLDRNRRYRRRLALTVSLLVLAGAVLAWFLWPFIAPPSAEL